MKEKRGAEKNKMYTKEQVTRQLKKGKKTRAGKETETEGKQIMPSVSLNHLILVISNA